MNTSAQGNYCNGMITEDCFSYQSTFEYIPPCSNKISTWEDYLVPLLDYAESWNNVQDPDFNDIIKSLLIQKGPLMAYFWASNRFIQWGGIHKDPLEYYDDIDEDCSHFVNHGCTIIGWKDDTSIPNGGYWICKNTWGPNWGNKGFFNIEYDCLNMGGFLAWVDYDPESFDWHPIADTGGFYTGEVGVDIQFDASQSRDAEGDIVEYRWDFGDDSQGEGITPNHTYTSSGVYTVSLTVVDEAGQETTQHTIAGVDEQPIQLGVTGGYGLTISFENPTQIEMKDWDLSIECNGLLLPNKLYGFFETIPVDTMISNSYIILGLGPGSATISLNSYTKTIQFIIIGPFIFIF
jgi:hypothetical protein